MTTKSGDAVTPAPAELIDAAQRAGLSNDQIYELFYQPSVHPAAQRQPMYPPNAGQAMMNSQIPWHLQGQQNANVYQTAQQVTVDTARVLEEIRRFSVVGEVKSLDELPGLLTEIAMLVLTQDKDAYKAAREKLACVAETMGMMLVDRDSVDEQCEVAARRAKEQAMAQMYEQLRQADKTSLAALNRSALQDGVARLLGIDTT